MFEQLEPVGERIVVRKIEHEEKTQSGIILTTMTSEKNYALGIVVALPEARKPEAIPVGIGDTVIMLKYAGVQLGADLAIVQDSDVLGIVSKAF